LRLTAMRFVKEQEPWMDSNLPLVTAVEMAMMAARTQVRHTSSQQAAKLLLTSQCYLYLGACTKGPDRVDILLEWDVVREHMYTWVEAQMERGNFKCPPRRDMVSLLIQTWRPHTAGLVRAGSSMGRRPQALHSHPGPQIRAWTISLGSFLRKRWAWPGLVRDVLRQSWHFTACCRRTR
jgi:hypothetical protein